MTADEAKVKACEDDVRLKAFELAQLVKISLPDYHPSKRPAILRAIAGLERFYLDAKK
jgi:hypothetical protein